MIRRSHPVDWLAAATVDDAVFALRPDYRVLLLTAGGLHGGDPDEVSERTHRPSATRTGRSAPSRNAPARASKHCCVGSTGTVCCASTA